MPGFSVFVTLIAGALSLAAVRRSSRVLATMFASAVVLIALGVVVEADLGGWEAALVLAFAVSGGALAGRLLPPRAMPMAFLLGVVSVLDIVWIASGGSAGADLGDYMNLTVRIGETSGTLGTFDVLLAATVATHWQARGSSLALAVLAAPLGMVLGNLFFSVTGADSLPLVPFITAGWLISEAWYRWSTARTSLRA